MSTTERNFWLDALRANEGIGLVALGGQSYGGLLAQVILAQRLDDVDRLILSSTGPADFGPAWLPIEHVCIALTRHLPEKFVKSLRVSRLLRMITLPEAERADWQAAIEFVTHDQPVRNDVVSHFAVAADMVRKRIVVPAAYGRWPGRIIVLRAENDPTQNPNDPPRYEKLLGRAIEVVNLGTLGHTAAIVDPDRYVSLM